MAARHRAIDIARPFNGNRIENVVCRILPLEFGRTPLSDQDCQKPFSSLPK
jgi:hypothetical protein